MLLRALAVGVTVSGAHQLLLISSAQDSQAVCFCILHFSLRTGRNSLALWSTVSSWGTAPRPKKDISSPPKNRNKCAHPEVPTNGSNSFSGRCPCSGHRGTARHAEARPRPLDHNCKQGLNTCAAAGLQRSSGSVPPARWTKRPCPAPLAVSHLYTSGPKRLSNILGFCLYTLAGGGEYAGKKHEQGQIAPHLTHNLSKTPEWTPLPIWCMTHQGASLQTACDLTLNELIHVNLVFSVRMGWRFVVCRHRLPQVDAVCSLH